MLKIYITAIDSRDNGTAVTLFEDYQVNYSSSDDIKLDETLGERLADKIEEVEKINNQVTSPF
jgi:hypothetical protein